MLLLYLFITPILIILFGFGFYCLNIYITKRSNEKREKDKLKKDIKDENIVKVVEILGQRYTVKIKKKKLATKAVNGTYKEGKVRYRLKTKNKKSDSKRNTG